MSDRRQKLLDELEQKRKGATPALLIKVMAAFGYKRVRKSGTHWTYTRKGGGRPLVMPYKRPHVREYFVDDVLVTLKPLLEAGDEEGSQ